MIMFVKGMAEAEANKFEQRLNDLHMRYNIWQRKNTTC